MPSSLRFAAAMLSAHQVFGYQLKSACKTVEELTAHEQRQVFAGLMLSISQKYEIQELDDCQVDAYPVVEQAFYGATFLFLVDVFDFEYGFL